MAKLDAKKLKEDFDALDDDDKKVVLSALGVSPDGDLTEQVKKILSRLDALEKVSKKGKGFFS